MKRSIIVFLVLMTFFSSLLIINIFSTKDQIRIENIETTENSFKIYVDNSTKTPRETLLFFNKLAKSQKVTIIRTDFSNQKVIKSAVLNKDSFPYTNFFQNDSKAQLFNNRNQTYTQKKSVINQRYIPTFDRNLQIRLQSMAKYFQNGDKSVNGIYTIIPENKNRKTIVVSQLVRFFNSSRADLLTSKLQSRKEFVNRNLMIYFALFLVLAIMAFLSIISLTMTNVKRIGIWKLSGFSNFAVIKALYLTPSLVLAFCILINFLFVKIAFHFHPNGFWNVFSLAQLVVIVILTVAVLISLVLVKSIHIVNFLKNTLNFRLGIFTMLVLKAITVILTTVLLIGTVANIRDIFNANETYRAAQAVNKNLTIEKIGFTGGEALRNFELNNGKNEATMGILFSKLDRKLAADFVYGEVIYPRKAFANGLGADEFDYNEKFTVVRVNQNYLKTIGLNVKQPSQNLILAPQVDRRQSDKIRKLGALIVSAQHPGEVSNKHSSKIKANIHFYERDRHYQTQIFDSDGNIHSVVNPIYEVIDTQNLDQQSKAQLLTTGVTNPIRLNNTAANREKLKALSSPKQLKGIKLQFSTIGSILNTTTASSRLGLTLALSALIIMFFVSLVTSLFASNLYFETNRSRLAVLRLLGIKIYDRYYNIFVSLFIMYTIQISAAVIFGKSIYALYIGVVLVLSDLCLTLFMLYRKENKNLIASLKGASS
ncbi:DUF1430 domain-containing protein [Agrilactobacillus fermenti]|uniref:DUF1430 domain-containing protein n=1 Tax=Agrilactobacillus fermenti TaxID=2586909 RepID=UPI001E305D51|nr:DUF1430 domain-containing protein [Agrilactobacillus fermenti]MCD2257322.1 DUF1430 domain-containing protein [Agrilactobacillus fermenti]